MSDIKEYIKLNTRNGMEEFLISESYSLLLNFFNFKEGGKNILVDDLINLNNGNFRNSQDLVRFYVENKSDNFNKFSTGFKMNGEYWKERFIADIEIALKQAIKENEELSKELNNDENFKDYLNTIANDSKLYKQYLKKMNENFPKFSFENTKELIAEYIGEGGKNIENNLTNNRIVVSGKEYSIDDVVRSEEHYNSIVDTFKAIEEKYELNDKLNESAVRYIAESSNSSVPGHLTLTYLEKDYMEFLNQIIESFNTNHEEWEGIFEENLDKSIEELSKVSTYLRVELSNSTKRTVFKNKYLNDSSLIQLISSKENYPSSTISSEIMISLINEYIEEKEDLQLYSEEKFNEILDIINDRFIIEPNKQRFLKKELTNIVKFSKLHRNIFLPLEELKYVAEKLKPYLKGINTESPLFKEVFIYNSRRVFEKVLVGGLSGKSKPENFDELYDKYFMKREVVNVASRIGFKHFAVWEDKENFEKELNKYFTEYSNSILPDIFSNSEGIQESISTQRNILKRSVVLLKFVKQNGDTREMLATNDIVRIRHLHTEQTREDFEKLAKDLQKSSGNVVNVFDIEKGQKRAYNPTRLVEFTIVDSTSMNNSVYSSIHSMDSLNDKEVMDKVSRLMTERSKLERYNAITKQEDNIPSEYQKVVLSTSEAPLIITGYYLDSDTARSTEYIKYNVDIPNVSIFNVQNEGMLRILKERSLELTSNTYLNKVAYEENRERLFNILPINPRVSKELEVLSSINFNKVSKYGVKVDYNFGHIIVDKLEKEDSFIPFEIKFHRDGTVSLFAGKYKTLKIEPNNLKREYENLVTGGDSVSKETKKLFELLSKKTRNVIVKELENRGAVFTNKTNFVNEMSAFYQKHLNELDKIECTLDNKNAIRISKTNMDKVMELMIVHDFKPTFSNFKQPIKSGNKFAFKEKVTSIILNYLENNSNNMRKVSISEIGRKGYYVLDINDKIFISFAIALTNNENLILEYLNKDLDRMFKDFTNISGKIHFAIDFEDLEYELKNNVLEFNYTNLNGNHVRMLATLNKEVIEIAEIMKNGKNFKGVEFPENLGGNSESIYIYDINNKSPQPFRRILIDRINYTKKENSGKDFYIIPTYNAKSSTWLDRYNSPVNFDLNSNNQVDRGGVISDKVISSKYKETLIEVLKVKEELGILSDKEKNALEKLMRIVENEKQQKNGKPTTEQIQKLKILGTPLSNPITKYLESQGIKIDDNSKFTKKLVEYYIENLDRLEHFVIEPNKKYINLNSVMKAMSLDSTAKGIYLNHGKFKGISLFKVEDELEKVKRSVIAQSQSNNIPVSPVFIDLNINDFPKYKQIYADTIFDGRKVFLETVEKELKEDVVNLESGKFDGRNLSPKEFLDILTNNIVVLQHINEKMETKTIMVTTNEGVGTFLTNRRMRNRIERAVEDGSYVEYREFNDDPQMPATNDKRDKTRVFDVVSAYNKKQNAYINIVQNNLITTNSEENTNMMIIDINNHIWWEMLVNKSNILSELNGNVDLKTGEVVKSVKRSDLVEEMKYIHDLVNKHNDKDNDNPENMTEEEIQREHEIRVYTYRQVQKALKTVPEYTRYDKELYEQFTSVLDDDPDNNFRAMSTKTSLNTEKELVMSGRYPNQCLVIFQASGVTYYVHPYFMINDLGSKIYRDRTGTIVPFNKRATTLPSDEYNEKYLTRLENLVKKRREGDGTRLAQIKGNDLKRYKRLEQFSLSETMEHFKIENMKLKYISAGEHSHLLILYRGLDNKNHTLRLTPTMLAIGETGQIIHRLRSGESHYNSFLESWKVFSKQIPKEVAKELITIAKYSLDLRTNMNI